MDEITVCTECGHSHPDEVAPAWGLPGRGPLCADCWSTQTEIAEADKRGDWETVARLAALERTCL